MEGNLAQNPVKAHLVLLPKEKGSFRLAKQALRLALARSAKAAGLEIVSGKVTDDYLFLNFACAAGSVRGRRPTMNVPTPGRARTNPSLSSSR